MITNFLRETDIKDDVNTNIACECKKPVGYNPPLWAEYQLVVKQSRASISS